MLVAPTIVDRVLESAVARQKSCLLHPMFNMCSKSQRSFKRQCHEWEAKAPVAATLSHQNIHGNTFSQLCLAAHHLDVGLYKTMASLSVTFRITFRRRRSSTCAPVRRIPSPTCFRTAAAEQLSRGSASCMCASVWHMAGHYNTWSHDLHTRSAIAPPSAWGHPTPPKYPAGEASAGIHQFICCMSMV